MDTFDWTAEAVARLRTLWEEGHATAEIARRIGATKNAVIGKAHRINLPARPSPIRQNGTARPLTRRVTGPTLPALASAAPGSVGPPTLAPSGRVASPSLPAPAPRPAALPQDTRPRHRPQPCCWPIGEPGHPGFRFCEGEAEPGRPYCPEHASLAYAKPAAPKEDSATRRA